ncbi:MAG: polyprenol monophosphomannose synthase [Actinomycetota bacterium]|nr:polyprenol monophosphomannose synthase [Actinomycetota bacterium]
MRSPPGRALVVTPTYNERDTVADLVRRALTAADVDVLIVDDASPDGTGTIADELAAAHPRVHVLHRAAKHGLGSAYRTGFRWGMQQRFDVFVEMDADLSHDPGQLPQLLEATRTSDVVVGSRYVRGGHTRNWPWYRRLLSWGGNLYVQLVTGIPVRDATSGYRAFRREVLAELEVESLRSDGYSFQVETVLRAWRAGFVVTEIPITFVERRTGSSKISRAIVVEAVWRVLRWGLQGPRNAADRHPRSVRSPVG